NMPQYIAAADLLIGKAGGVTASEALSAGVPMIILDPLPGQEERNAAYLQSHGAAERADTHEEMAFHARNILFADGRWDELHRKAAAIGHPNSAEAACKEILRLTSVAPA